MRKGSILRDPSFRIPDVSELVNRKREYGSNLITIGGGCFSYYQDKFRYGERKCFKDFISCYLEELTYSSNERRQMLNTAEMRNLKRIIRVAEKVKANSSVRPIFHSDYFEINGLIGDVTLAIAVNRSLPEAGNEISIARIQEELPEATRVVIDTMLSNTGVNDLSCFENDANKHVPLMLILENAFPIDESLTRIDEFELV